MQRSLRKRKQQLHLLFLACLGLTVFTAIFLVFTVYANWAAVKNEVAYRLQQPPVPTPLPLPSKRSAATPAPTPTPIPIVEAPHIIIDKIGLDVPISWDVPVDQTVEYLNHGVAHLAGSAHLGEIGNVFITGHSSDYVWKKNPYAAVFSLLPKLEDGDTITVRENGKTYVYRLISTRIVNPDQVEVTKPTLTPILSLMTCYPVGSTRQRYIVQAALISSPEKPVAVSQQQAETLPAIKFR